MGPRLPQTCGSETWAGSGQPQGSSDVLWASSWCLSLRSLGVGSSTMALVMSWWILTVSNHHKTENQLCVREDDRYRGFIQPNLALPVTCLSADLTYTFPYIPGFPPIPHHIPCLYPLTFHPCTNQPSHHGVCPESGIAYMPKRE